MFIDIVLPNKNESALIEMAERLGIDGLCLAYDTGTVAVQKQRQKAIADLQAKTKVMLYLGELVDPAKQKKQPTSSAITIAKSSTDDRVLLEHGAVDVIYALEAGKKPDSLHYRSSGLNQVLCALATAHDVCIGFSVSMILQSSGVERAVLLGRMRQNIRLCRKYKVRNFFASFASSPWEMRASHDIKCLGIVLGMHPAEAATSCANLAERIEENCKRHEGKMPARGIEVLDD